MAIAMAKQQAATVTQAEKIFHNALASSPRLYTMHFSEAFYDLLAMSNRSLASTARTRHSWKDHLMNKVARDVLKLDENTICVEQQELRYNYRFGDALSVAMRSENNGAKSYDDEF